MKLEGEQLINLRCIVRTLSVGSRMQKSQIGRMIEIFFASTKGSEGNAASACSSGLPLAALRSPTDGFHLLRLSSLLKRALGFRLLSTRGVFRGRCGHFVIR
jgi:hypothetical protein